MPGFDHQKTLDGYMLLYYCAAMAKASSVNSSRRAANQNDISACVRFVLCSMIHIDSSDDVKEEREKRREGREKHNRSKLLNSYFHGTMYLLSDQR